LRNPRNLASQTSSWLKSKTILPTLTRARETIWKKRELRQLLQSLGEEATPTEVDKVLKEYDTDGDGKIIFSEFQHLMFKKLGDTNTIDEIKQAFKYLSYDKDTITEENLTSVINDISFKDRHVNYLKKEMKLKSGGYDWGQWTQEVFDR